VPGKLTGVNRRHYRDIQVFLLRRIFNWVRRFSGWKNWTNGPHGLCDEGPAERNRKTSSRVQR